MPFDDIFNPFERLLNVTILGRSVQMPENNSILRGLQYLGSDSISSEELCWNGDCLNCMVGVRKKGEIRSVIACRTEVFEGMEIVKLAPALDIFSSGSDKEPTVLKRY